MFQPSEISRKERRRFLDEDSGFEGESRFPKCMCLWRTRREVQLKCLDKILVLEWPDSSNASTYKALLASSADSSGIEHEDEPTDEPMCNYRTSVLKESKHHGDRKLVADEVLLVEALAGDTTDLVVVVLELEGELCVHIDWDAVLSGIFTKEQIVSGTFGYRWRLEDNGEHWTLEIGSYGDGELKATRRVWSQDEISWKCILGFKIVIRDGKRYAEREESMLTTGISWKHRSSGEGPIYRLVMG